MNYLIVLTFNISLLMAFIPTRDDAILFCIRSDIENLDIINRDNIISVNNSEINSIIKNYQIKKIERWLPHARENENFNDLYLNRIFRLVIDGTRDDLESLKLDFDSLSSIHSSEYEFIRQPTYTPNDSQYGQQWFLPQVNADAAWDFWDISGGWAPGDESVLLASVDTGVDWDHSDLRDNIWNNLGEDIDGDGQTIIESGGSWIFDPDDINFIDDDGNGYIDDFIGWDCSGVSGGEDNNPMPPAGVSNGGTWAHGTHVAGLLSATTDNNTGISSASFNCSIMCVKVSTGEQDYPYITHGYNGILYASQAGHDAGTYAIIYNSIGACIMSSL
jgi:subtilisin family serine protease